MPDYNLPQRCPACRLSAIRLNSVQPAELHQTRHPQPSEGPADSIPFPELLKDERITPEWTLAMSKEADRSAKRILLQWWRVLGKYPALRDDVDFGYHRLLTLGKDVWCCSAVDRQQAVPAALSRTWAKVPACLIEGLDPLVDQEAKALLEHYPGLCNPAYTPNLPESEVAKSLAWALRTNCWDTGAIALLMSRAGGLEIVRHAVHAAVWRSQWKSVGRFPDQPWETTTSSQLELSERLYEDDERLIPMGQHISITLTLYAGSDRADVRAAALRACDVALDERPAMIGKRGKHPEYARYMEAWLSLLAWREVNGSNREQFLRERAAARTKTYRPKLYTTKGKLRKRREPDFFESEKDTLDLAERWLMRLPGLGK